MIHRQYVVKLPIPIEQLAGSCDIIVELPGSYTNPVADGIGAYPGATVTQPSAAWIAQCGDAAYYEIRARSIPLEMIVGDPGFTPRTRLGGYISVVGLQSPNNLARQLAGAGIQIPFVSFSESLARQMGTAANAMIWGDYINTFADPAYGPVIRIWNSASLHTADPEMENPIYLVSFGLAEAKDEDFEASGHF